ncbi:hypothetical protein [Streptomyces sp. DT2A-34]
MLRWALGVPGRGHHGRAEAPVDAPVKFVQIIDFETERIDEMRELGQ